MPRAEHQDFLEGHGMWRGIYCAIVDAHPALARADRRWTRPGLTEAIRRMAERAGIERLPVRPHVLRHTANVVARSAGIDPFVRSKLLNHLSPQSLERYEHLVPDELHEARGQAQAGLARYLGVEGPDHMPHLYVTDPEGPGQTLRKDRDQPYDEPCPSGSSSTSS